MAAMSILPEPNTPWPPKSERARYDRMRSCLAWYGGDPAKLAALPGGVTQSVTGGVRTTLNPNGSVKSQTATGRDRFWGARNSDDEVDTRRHLPVAQDIAATSAELLFSEMPFVRVDGPTEEEVSEDGKSRAHRPTKETRAAQQRLDKVLDKCNFHQTLMAAAETASPLGSAGLRIAIDKTAIPDRPVITRVDAVAVIPRYSWGQLVGVWFWQVVKTDRDKVWRHIEAHQAGRVYHGLYEGDADNLGDKIDLSELGATAHLADQVDDEGGITIDAGLGKTGTSIPNMLPDPLDLQNNAGRSDYTPAVQGVFDDIDRVYSQMMESIDDARSRLFIAESMLERNGPGRGVSFNQEQRIFNKVKLPPSDKEPTGLPIEKVQFDMRVQEYLQAIDALVTKAVEMAGYTADTEHDDRGAPMTATEYQGRNQRSMRTRGKKIGYWHAELEDILTTLLRIDVAEFSPIEFVDDEPVVVRAFPVEVEFPQAVQPTMLELAGVARALREAEAASKTTLVKTVHPDWDEVQVQQEVTRILNEGSVIDPVLYRGEGDSMLPTPAAAGEATTPSAAPPPGGADPGDVAEAANALGQLIRSGVDPEDAAARVGLAGIRFSGAMPVSLRLPKEEASDVEER